MGDGGQKRQPSGGRDQRMPGAHLGEHDADLPGAVEQFSAG